MRRLDLYLKAAAKILRDNPEGFTTDKFNDPNVETQFNLLKEKIRQESLTLTPTEREQLLVDAFFLALERKN